MINDGLFTSNTDLWETPNHFFNKLNKEFNFNLDVCANYDNRKCEKYYDKEMNGLIQQWVGICWMNPPYGREIKKWVEKAYKESLYGNTIVCLLPARTDTKWFHDYCVNGEIRFVKGRLKFGDSKNSAPFPSMVVIFGEGFNHRILTI
jgi:phage N-6-adenine-methyltransferase